MREIILYGAMRRQFGRRFFLDVANPAEAIRALMAVVPGFKVWFTRQAQANAAYHVLVGKKDLNKDQLRDPHPETDAIRIAPALRGAKAGALQTVLGAVLVVVGALITGLSYGWAAPIGNAFMSAGIGMMIGGIAQMLAPQRVADTPDERAGNKPSAVFTGAVNTTAQGHPVPLLFGELVIGSAVVSAGISTDDVAL